MASLNGCFLNYDPLTLKQKKEKEVFLFFLLNYFPVLIESGSR